MAPLASGPIRGGLLICPPRCSIMRIARLFHPAPLAPNSAVTLTADATRHARSVLRLGQDQEVELFDGEGMACRGRLQLGPGALVQVRLDTLCTQQPAPLPHVELALGVSKGERMDLAIQKAVELGVGAITPLITQRSVVRLDPQASRKTTPALARRRAQRVRAMRPQPAAARRFADPTGALARDRTGASTRPDAHSRRRAQFAHAVATPRRPCSAADWAGRRAQRRRARGRRSTRLSAGKSRTARPAYGNRGNRYGDGRHAFVGRPGLAAPLRRAPAMRRRGCTTGIGAASSLWTAPSSHGTSPSSGPTPCTSCRR